MTVRLHDWVELCIAELSERMCLVDLLGGFAADEGDGRDDLFDFDDFRMQEKSKHTTNFMIGCLFSKKTKMACCLLLFTFLTSRP